MQQSPHEVNRIFEEWKSNFAPKDVLLLDGEPAKSNVNALADYVALHFGGIVSITNLDAAVENLPNLKYKPKKTALEIETEFRTKELQRRQREAAENAVPFNHAKAVKAETDKATHDKEQALAANSIEAAILGYQCTKGPNRLDYSLMEQRQGKLRGIVAANPRMDRIKLLALIRQTILNFPDMNERSR
jgi:hypothetical protein